MKEEKELSDNDIIMQSLCEEEATLKTQALTMKTNWLKLGIGITRVAKMRADILVEITELERKGIKRVEVKKADVSEIQGAKEIQPNAS